MLGVLTFILGLALGATLSPYGYLLCVPAVLGTALVQFTRG